MSNLVKAATFFAACPQFLALGELFKTFAHRSCGCKDYHENAKCEECDEYMCSGCLKRPCCGAHNCSDCSDTKPCVSCEKPVCRDCFRQCRDCELYKCAECVWECATCDHQECVPCRAACGECTGPMCSGCDDYCTGCGKRRCSGCINYTDNGLYCGDCVDDDSDGTLLGGKKFVG